MSKRILVVEDQPDNRQIIRDMLAPTDYEITEAENGLRTRNADKRPPASKLSKARQRGDRNSVVFYAAQNVWVMLLLHI